MSGPSEFLEYQLQLEQAMRERDEARAALFQMQNAAVDLAQRVERAEKERDEARAVLESEREALAVARCEANGLMDVLHGRFDRHKYPQAGFVRAGFAQLQDRLVDVARRQRALCSVAIEGWRDSEIRRNDGRSDERIHAMTAAAAVCDAVSLVAGSTIFDPNKGTP